MTTLMKKMNEKIFQTLSVGLQKVFWFVQPTEGLSISHRRLQSSRAACFKSNGSIYKVSVSIKRPQLISIKQLNVNI